jgi:GH24 family phage-related lysozyme (muramidase)
MNFITGGSPLGSSVFASAANKIVGFQRGAAGVAPKAPDLGSIISTLSSNILNNVQNQVQSVNQNVSNIINQTLKTFGQDYQNRLKQIDDAKPNRILSNFLKMYQQAIEYIQFLGNRKNIRTLGDNIQSLQRIFAETFEVAKIIRQTIIKIVKQLSNLPTASTGGGGLNLDVNVPGGPLRRSAPRGLNRMLKIAGTGAAIAGAGALGSKVVSGMMDIGDGDVQPVVGDGSEGLSGPILDRFNAILDRFSAAIDSLSRRPPSKPSAPGGGGGEAPAAAEKTAPGGGGGGGSVTATGSEQQKTEALIAGEEGVVLKAYQNPGDVPTIGYGQTRINGRSVRLGDTMTKEQAVGGLRSNIESHRAKAVRDIGKESWDNIKDENSKAVLTSIAYNYGHIPKSLIPAAKSGDPKKISDAVRALTDPSNRSYDSRLIGRRNREADFILSGTSSRLDKDFLAGGKLTVAGGSVSTTTPGSTPPSVAAAPTQAATAQQVSQTVSQPPPQQQSQVNILPMNLGSAQPQQSQKSATPSSPPPAMSSGRNLINLSSTNHDNFLTLYSKMVYNIVDG